VKADSLRFAWRNLWRGDRLRALVAVAGAGMASFVVLLHLTFLHTVGEKASQLYDLFDADVVLVSSRFQFLYNIPEFPLARLRQADALEGVESMAAVSIGSTQWQAEKTQALSSMLIIGIDASPVFLKDQDIRLGMEKLKHARQILLDRYSGGDVGDIEVGLNGRIGGQSATVAGLYSLGLPMYAESTAIVSRSAFQLYTDQDPLRIALGLLRLQAGLDAADYSARLNALLPDDVRAMPIATLRKQEQDYFLDVKPLGIMVRFGLLVGLLVGAAALYQALASQIEARQKDFAVLRAMGFSARFTYRVGAFQLLILGGLAFGLAWLAALPTFAVIGRLTGLSMTADWRLLAESSLLCLPMMATAALPVLRAGKAEPARLFR
jgi:putative ABC transport system permease protein